MAPTFWKVVLRPETHVATLSAGPAPRASRSGSTCRSAARGNNPRAAPLPTPRRRGRSQALSARRLGGRARVLYSGAHSHAPDRGRAETDNRHLSIVSVHCH